MSRPSPGNYLIYSRVLSPSGHKLAMTFKGENQFATVEDLADQENKQIWMVQDAGSEAQAVVPSSAANLQAAWGDQAVNVIRAGGFVWIIRSTEDDGYTIQDGGRTANWGVTKGIEGEKVAITKDEGRPNQRWILEKV